jgi:hypothetical protein
MQDEASRAVAQMDTAEIEKTIIDKIKFQWKTIRKAFIDLNKEKTGSIEA